MKKSILFVLLGNLVLAAGAATAEFQCEDGWTLQECYDKAADDAEAKKKAAQTGIAKAEKEMVGETTQKTTPSNMSAQSGSLIDLLPSFLGAIGLDGFNETQAGGLAFDKTFTLGGGPLRLALGGEVQKPTLFGALEEKLEDLDLRDLRDELDDEQGDFASVDYRVRLSLEGSVGNRRFGRDVRRYRDMIDHYYASVTTAAATSPERLPAWAIGARSLGGSADDPNTLFRMTVEAFKDEFPERSGAQLTALVEAARGTEALLTNVDRTLDQLVDLVNNQPQFLIDVTYKDRQDLTGPTSIEGSLRYEMGMAGNVNDYLRWARGSRDPACTSAWSPRPDGTDLPSYACYERYVTVAKKNAAERGNRLSLEVTYEKTDAFTYALPDGNAPFALDETEKWEASLTYGRYLNDFSFLRTAASADLEDRARLDLEAKYEDVSGDPMRQSRFVATLTLTQAVTDGADLSISAVYANKPEYLGEVDQEVSARFGLKWSGFGGRDTGTGGGS